MSHDVFISYSVKDLSVAEAVCRGLEDAGLKCWFASRDMPPGSDHATVILDALKACRAVTVLLSASANESRQIAREIERAISMCKHLILFRIEEVQLAGSLEYLLSGFQQIDASRHPVEDHIGRLAFSLQALGDVSRSKQTEPAHAARPNHQLAAPAVFISYRREDGSQTARLLRAELKQRGFRTFLDVDDLRPGHFDEALLRQIDSAPNFLLILSPHSLDRCRNDRDWLRREIAHAIETNRNIVPVIMPGFEFPDSDGLPDDIASLPLHHGIPYSHDFFDAMMEKLGGYLSE